MRNIKFRGWEASSNTMIDWSCMRQTAFNTQSIAEQHNATSIYSPLFYRMFNNPSIELMQYTGLKDRNGVDIYEGDLIRSLQTSITYQVIWDDDEARFKTSSKMTYMDADSFSKSEVIGNIYENPDALR